jgi:hemolysin activation/secretion protein
MGIEQGMGPMALGRPQPLGSRTVLTLLHGGVITLGIAASAMAQTPPRPLALPRDRPPSDRQSLPKLRPADLLLPPLPDASPPPESPQTITVQQFQVTGSTVFTDAELEAVTRPFTHRPLSLAALFEARSAITQLYINRGYITSGAYLPPQNLGHGMVTIAILEGRLEAIDVKGLRRLQPDYVRSRLALATTAPLNRDRLLEALRLLQLDPLIQTLSAELSSGGRPGESRLEVQIREAKSLDWQAGVDNGQAPSVGPDRHSLQVRQWFGGGDKISLGYSHTRGSNSVDLSYIRPINARNGTLQLSLGGANSRVVESPFSGLDIQAQSRYAELTLRQPVWQTSAQELALSLTASHRTSRATYLDDLPFPAADADDQGRTRVTTLRFAQDWTDRGDQQVLALRSQVIVGFPGTSELLPNSPFFAWRGQGQWVRRLAPETLLLLRADVQLADRLLPGLEQSGLGGPNTVRGYRQDVLLTDNSLFLSAELRIPLWQRRQSVLQLTPFVEFGTGWNRGGRPNPDSSRLAAAGLGLRWQFADRVTARLDWGIPLLPITGQKRSWQENGVHFSITGSN